MVEGAPPEVESIKLDDLCADEEVNWSTADVVRLDMAPVVVVTRSGFRVVVVRLAPGSAPISIMVFAATTVIIGFAAWISMVDLLALIPISVCDVLMTACVSLLLAIIWELEGMTLRSRLDDSTSISASAIEKPAPPMDMDVFLSGRIFILDPVERTASTFDVSGSTVTNMLSLTYKSGISSYTTIAQSVCYTKIT